MTPTYVPKFSYIIPFQFSPDRIIGLKRVVEWLSGFQGIEVIIVEQDKHSKIDYMNIKGTHIFVESTLPFNKSWAYNIGLKMSSSPIIIFGEADYIMNPMELIESLKVLDTFDCVIPTNRMVNLSQRESMMDTMSIMEIKNSAQKSNSLDGISIFKKEAINRIGGWNEDMIGLGFENEFTLLKIKQMLKYKEMEYTGYHLFHNKIQTSPQLSQRNKQIFEAYSKDTNQINQHIQQTLPKIGTKNRFVKVS